MIVCEQTELLDSPLTEFEEDEQTYKVWKVIVWNDPINTMDFVVAIFMKVLSMSKANAEKHMMEVHKNGKSIVFSGEKEKAEHYVYQILAYHLKATLEQDE